MTVVSTTPAFKAALLARLTADASIGGAGVQVSWGHTYPTRPEGELVHIGAATPGDLVGGRAAGRSPVSPGKLNMEERYLVPVTVSVLASAREPLSLLETRGYVIASLIDASLRAWEQPGGVLVPFDGVVRWVRIAQVEDGEYLDNDNRESRVTLTLSVAART